MGQGFASPTQPAESKEDINLNLDCSNTLPDVATDASIKGASCESNSEGDDADREPAWRICTTTMLWEPYGAWRWRCLICEKQLKAEKLYHCEESFLSHFKEDHANNAEWMDDMERC